MRRTQPRYWKPIGVLAVTAMLIVPLLIFGGPAFARSGDAASSQYEYSSSTQYKLTICHRTHSKKHPWVQITISSKAWPAHQRHGDTTPPCAATSSAKTSEHSGQAEHGSSQAEHGQSSSSHGHGKH